VGVVVSRGRGEEEERGIGLEDGKLGYM